MRYVKNKFLLLYSYLTTEDTHNLIFAEFTDAPSSSTQIMKNLHLIQWRFA